MIEYGRFGLRPLSDGGADLLTRTLLSADITTAISEGRRLQRVAQSMTDSGRDASEVSDKAATLLMKAMRSSVELIEASVMALDGVAVDMDDEEDAARVRKALGKLSKEQWEGLTHAMQDNPKSG